MDYMIVCFRILYRPTGCIYLPVHNVCNVNCLVYLNCINIALLAKYEHDTY